MDYIFGFDATAHVAPDFVYQGLADSYVAAPEMRDFLAQSNPWALHAIAERLLEAAERGMWQEPDAGTLDAAAADTARCRDAGGGARRTRAHGTEPS